MNKKIKICTDMDDTLENLTEVWVDGINKRNSTDYSVEKNLTQWDMTKCLNLPPDKIYEVLHDLSTYEKNKTSSGSPRIR